MKTLLILFIALSSSFANAYGYYGWSVSGDCRYYSNGGRVGDIVGDDYCGGGTYNWDVSGYCRYYSNGGRIGSVAGDSYCN